MCDEPSSLDLAETGYQAYGDRADWTNHAGNAMPSWGELPQPQRLAWSAAAEAIRTEILMPRRRAPRSAYEASHPMMSGCSGAGPQHVEIGDAQAAEPGGRA